MYQNPFYILIALNFVLTYSRTDGLYFHLSEGERKCFIEEVPSETQVTGNSLSLHQLMKGLIEF